MAGTATDEDTRRALDRFAELILFEPAFMERFTSDARGVRGDFGLEEVPAEVMDAVAELSTDEMRVLAQIHQRRKPIDLSDHVAIFF